MVDRIMLVEDEVIVAMDVQQRLEKLGYEVVAHATSGEEALRFAEKTNPDLILMDIKIRGEMDGIETASHIRKSQDIPIIYVTAFSGDETIKRARETEAFGYLIKPFDDRELRSSIEVAIYKHRIEKKLRESEERYALAARASNDGNWDWDLLNGQVYYSPRWKAILGLEEDLEIYSPEDWFSRVHADDIERLKLAISNHLEGFTPTLECEYRILHEDGFCVWTICRGLALFDKNGKPYRLAGSHADITKRKEYEKQLTLRALHDELTGLPNRALFMDRLRMVFEQARRSEERTAAVLFLDVDHFKVINDSMGHVSGDELLKAFARRLEQCLRTGDTVARFGGDEFAILADNIQRDEDAIQIAERINIILKKPFLLDGLEFFVSASIGIVFVTSHYKFIEDLMRDVDAAMYHAKFSGRARYKVFDVSMHERMVDRLRLESEIRRGLDNKEFILHYQPIYSIEPQNLIGFEALIRWQHPVRGLQLPQDFIQMAEESGMIIPMGEWVVRVACKQAQAWQKMTGKALKMAVNISAVQFNDENLVKVIRSALDESGLEPSLLELELTETTAMKDINKTADILKEIQKMGVLISIDDFGSGYSSLDHLKNFVTNSLKIDKTFIQEIEKDDSAIVTAIITMAHQMKLKVVAEGVETQEQLMTLSQNDCDMAQGFFLGKVLDPDTISDSLLVLERR
jgi:diguanylate cyclase (GGDEF)-like protein/PAS domain S-box-containing protein